jgi:hypothetical protein
MYKRLVDDALATGVLDVRELSQHTDESLFFTLSARHPTALLAGLRERRLYKRAFECPSAELPDPDAGEWLASDRWLVVHAENALARELGLAPGELLLDYPEKTQMLGLDIPVRLRDGEVRRLSGEGLEGAINLPLVSEQLYRSARWLRVFVARPVSLARRAVLQLAEWPGSEVRRRLDAGESMLDTG